MYKPHFLQCSADDNALRRRQIAALNEVPSLRELKHIVRVCKNIRTEATLEDSEGKRAGRVHADGSYFIKGEEDD